MAAVFPQMRGDAIGTCLLGETRGADRIGMLAAARIANCRDVIDVDAEAQLALICFARRHAITLGRVRPS